MFDRWRRGKGRRTGRIDRELLIPFPEWEQSFDDFDAGLDAWAARFRSAVAIASTEQDKFSATGIWTARRLVASQSANVAARLYNLGDGIALALNNQNRHLLAPILRTMYEAAGMTAYTHRHFLPLLRKGERKGRAAKVMLFRLGLSADVGVGGEIKPYPVSSVIRALAGEMAEQLRREDPEGETGEDMAKGIQFFYSAASDYTHPNGRAMEGSFHRFGDTGSGIWKLGNALTDDDMGMWFNGAETLLAIVGPIWDSVMDAADNHPLILPKDDEFGFDQFPAEALNPPTNPPAFLSREDEPERG
jgi:hypothetical protein